MQMLNLSTVMPESRFSTDELMEVFPCPLPQGVRQNILNLGVSKRYLIDAVDLPSEPEGFLNNNALVNLCVEACEKGMQRTNLSKVPFEVRSSSLQLF